MSRHSTVDDELRVVAFVDLEVARLQLKRHAGLPRQCVLEGGDQVKVERIAEAIALGLVGADLGYAAMVGRVRPAAVLEQALVDVAQRELADTPHALGRERHVLALLHHVAALFQQQHHLAQVLEILLGLLAQHLAQIIHRDFVEVARHQILLELLHAIHLAHQLERLLVVQALGPVEQVLVALAEVFEVADVLVLLEQRLEIGARLGVLELVALEFANRFREPPRHPLKLAQLLVEFGARMLGA